MSHLWPKTTSNVVFSIILTGIDFTLNKKFDLKVLCLTV